MMAFSVGGIPHRYDADAGGFREAEQEETWNRIRRPDFDRSPAQV
jgi:hypothetical protein